MIQQKKGMSKWIWIILLLLLIAAGVFIYVLLTNNPGAIITGPGGRIPQPPALPSG